MKLHVGRITTRITGGFTEVEFLRNALAVKGPKDELLSLVEVSHGDLVFYTGLLSRAEAVLSAHQVEYELVPEFDPAEVELPSRDEIARTLPGIELRDHQVMAIQKALVAQRGIIDIATGGGKTEIQLALPKLLSQRHGLPGKKALILVTGLKSMAGTLQRAKKYGLEAGAFYADEKDLSKPITVGVVDSVYSAVKQGTREFLRFARQECTVLEIDECHHLPADTWAKTAAAFQSPFRFAFSGSPFASQGDLEYSDMQLIGLTGEVIAQVPAWYLIERGLLAKPLVTMVEVRHPRLFPGNTSWFYCYPFGIVKNRYRNEIALRLALQLRAQGCKVLVLVHQVNHGYLLLSMLQDPAVKFSCGGDEVAVWTGHPDTQAVWGCPLECRNRRCRHDREIYPGIQVTKESSFATLDELLGMRAGIFIGSSVYTESVDIPDITDLIVLSGMKKYRQVVQRVGRALRPKPGENIVRIFDFMDKTHPVLWRHSNERVAVYQHEDYRYEVHHDLEAVNRSLPRPLVLDVDPYAELRKES